MPIKIATPISHLFEKTKFANAIAAESDFLECRDRSIEFNSFINKQILFHCELQPIHELSNKDWDYLKKIRNEKPFLKLISFHIASCYDKPEIRNHMFFKGGKRYLKSEMLQNARNNFSKIKALFGPNVKICVENNNYYPTEAYDVVTDPN